MERRRLCNIRFRIPLEDLPSHVRDNWDQGHFGSINEGSLLYNVAAEPTIQPITGEQLQLSLHPSTIHDDNAHLDVALCGFIGDRYVRVFNRFVRSNQS